MSVRRLADEAVQPASFAFTQENLEWAQRTIAKYPEGRQQSAVIPLLMRAQEQEGWVTRAAIEYVADMLGMPYIRVLEVATFYTQFQLAPVGKRAHVQVCGTTPCMLRGAGDLIEVCKRKIHPEPFHLNEDGSLSWEEVECLGACVNAPMVMIFKDTYEDLTPERLEEIIDAFHEGKGDTIKPGTQIDRFNSAPAGGFTALANEVDVIKVPNPDLPARFASSPSATVPPTEAGRRRTDAIETNPAVSSPSAAKVSGAAESAASVSAPAENPAQADRVAEEVERTVRTRTHSGKPEEQQPELRAPELSRVDPIPDLSDDDRPVALPRPEKPDNLQLISGIGPKIEAILNELGIYTYVQIAAWGPRERAWVDRHLQFHGRIERENWVGQAEALARGGEAEYERVFGKKPR